MNGTDLLAEFRQSGAEEAFRELVRRYTNLVYSVAYRRLGNLTQAQEVAQTVFLRLAKAAPKLRSDADLAAWLHRTTVHASIDLWRAEFRRRAREEHAAAMQPAAAETATWNEIAPVLDEALNELADADRQALLLRFFEQKSMRELGGALGVSEDAAKMRVSRALERLRTLFGQRGVKCGALVLSGLLAERAVEAAPSQVVTALAALRLPAAAAGTGAGLALLLAQLSKAKLAAGLVAAALLGTGAFVALHRLAGPGHTTTAASQITPPSQAASADSAAPLSPTSALASVQEQQPDPRKLLQAVARARSHITSGQMEFETAHYDFSHPLNGTNQTRLKVVFDDTRRRFESFATEYAYVSLDSDTNAAADARIQAEHLDRQAQIQAGLIQPFDSHHVTIYDGSAIMDYWDTGNGHPRTALRDPAQGSAVWLFDPRILGLSGSLGVNSSVETCLGSSRASSVECLGEEPVFGVPAWHIQVQNRSGGMLHYWLDTAHPTRVLKLMQWGQVVLATYDDNNPQNPLPTMVQITDSQNGAPRYEQRITCTSAKYDLPVAPETFTVAGLGMPVGTDVNDDRIHRRIGYWNGAGLSDNPPAKGATPLPAANREELLATLDREPESPVGFAAAQWLVLNTPDGPELDKAAQVILDDHIRSTNLLHLALELERLRPRCATNLLTAMLAQNPLASIRGNACFSLATLRKDQADYGKNQPATDQAKRLFERVLSEFGQVKRNGTPLAELAQPQLTELRRLLIGQAAPATEGEDLDGQPLRLSDYRGKVVVLNFWGQCGGCRPEMDSLLKLLARRQGQPLVMLGVYCDNDDAATAKALAEQLGMTWPSFRDGRSGPISQAWNNDSWPTFDVVDAQGIIRYRRLTQVELPGALEKLLRE